jgi:hypothetical protein
LQIAKKPGIALQVEDAVQQYVLYIPDFDAVSNRGHVMANYRELISYGLKSKVNFATKLMISSGYFNFDEEGGFCSIGT